MDSAREAAPAQPSLESRRGAWLRLVLVLVCCVASLLLLTWASRRQPTPPRSFESRPLERMQGVKPDVVLIGNSMVKTRFHERTLNALLTPTRVLLVAQGGSMSSRWYLFLKNYVIASGWRPRRVLIFFRDRELTRPRLRLTGIHLARLQAATPEEDPVLEEKIAPPPEEPIDHLGWRLGRLVPVTRLADLAREPLARFASHSSGYFAPLIEEGNRLDAINSVFELDQLRASVDDRKEDTDLGPPFSRVERTFLPNILQLARENQIALTFVRVRNRSVADGIPDDPQLVHYLTELRAYLADQGALYVDMSTPRGSSRGCTRAPTTLRDGISAGTQSYSSSICATFSSDDAGKATGGVELVRRAEWPAAAADKRRLA